MAARAPRHPPRFPARALPRPPRLRAVILPGEEHTDDDQEIAPENVPFVPWPQFAAEYPLREPAPMRQAEMITLLGLKGSGKTTLAVRYILPQFKSVLVLATKQQDDELYPQLKRRGFYFTSKPKLNFKEHPRIVYKPPMAGLSKDLVKPQAAGFAAVLDLVYAVGNVAMYCDEIRFLTDNLGLRSEIETLWLQGRSNRITMIAATQEPVSVPRVVFNQIDHLFVWKYSQRERTKIAAEMTGNSYESSRLVIPTLAKHEALYCRLEDDEIVRTRYQLR